MKRIFLLLLLAVLLLGGCSVQTVDEMYAIPKRSEDYNDLQSAIDGAMVGLSYCAPLTGENQQPVQMADLNGDGVEEYLVFAKGTADRPLKILVFRQQNETYVHTDTLESSGAAFDQVEYVQLDENAGVEILVGCQVSDQVYRSMSAYTVEDGTIRQVITANYLKMLSLDMTGDGRYSILLARPGITDTDKGVVTLYSLVNGAVERSNEVEMSQPADKIKRIVVGKLQKGGSAVYIGSTVDETTLVTDVFALREGLLTNMTFSSESGTSIKTMRNYYIYADDVDDDGVVELPSLIPMKPMGAVSSSDQQHLIRWYAMTAGGEEVDKMYTFHSFRDGWYLQLDKTLAQRLTVNISGSEYRFFLWDEGYTKARELLTVTLHSPQTRLEQEELIVLSRTDTAVYTATLAPGAEKYGLTRESMIYNFRLIRLDWKTGET
jgi:hypothetical protein